MFQKTVPWQLNGSQTFAQTAIAHVTLSNVDGSIFWPYNTEKRTQSAKNFAIVWLKLKWIIKN